MVNLEHQVFNQVFDLTILDRHWLSVLSEKAWGAWGPNHEVISSQREGIWELHGIITLPLEYNSRSFFL